MSTMDVEAKESNNTENISNKSVVEVDEYYATDESEYEYDDDDDEYSYQYNDNEEEEDVDDAAHSGTLMSGGGGCVTKDFGSNTTVVPARNNIDRANAMSAIGDTKPTSLVPHSPPHSPPVEGLKKKTKWREPSRAAVKMSLRAEQETTGSKRRLAQDLYRIMNQDTHESGFLLEPETEDSMERWTIKLFGFDPDSELVRDMAVLGIDHIQLEMRFPEQYPFEPPFVMVVQPKFDRRTGFVMDGALCMELLTKDGWNPINDIESVIVSIRSLLVTGGGRLQAATAMSKERYDALLSAARKRNETSCGDTVSDGDGKYHEREEARSKDDELASAIVPKSQAGGSYTRMEAERAHSYLSKFHEEKGWSNSWVHKG